MNRKGLLGISMVLLALISLFVFSCEKGSTGPAGNTGPQGTPGPGGSSALNWTFIETDTTWSASGGEIVIDHNILVRPGATLTILPGTVVAFYPDVFIYIDGALKAEGTASQKITFKIKDEFVDLLNFEQPTGEKPARSKIKVADGYGYYFFQMGIAVETNGSATLKDTLFDHYLSFLSASTKNLLLDHNRFNGGEFTCIKGTPTITNNIFTEGSIYMEDTCCPALISGNSVYEIESYLTLGQTPCNLNINHNKVSGDIYLNLSSGGKKDMVAREGDISSIATPGDGDSLGQITFDVSDNTIITDYGTGIYVYSYNNIIDGVISHNAITGTDQGVYVNIYFSDTTTFSNLDIVLNNIQECDGNGILAYDQNYGTWVTIENNNVTNCNDWGIYGSGELRGNYLAGNRGAAATKVDTSSGGVVDHVYNSYSSSSPQQWGSVDACFTPRSTPNPDAGPR